MYFYFPFHVQFPYCVPPEVYGSTPLQSCQVQQPANNSDLLLAEPVQKSEAKKAEPSMSKEELLQEGYDVTKRPWSESEDVKLQQLIELHGLSWYQIAPLIPGRNEKMCYSRYRRLLIDAKFHWRNGDNAKIIQLVEKHGCSWKLISRYFTKRTAKQIREHYLNHLRPTIDKKDWTVEEDQKILELLRKQGKKWKSFEPFFIGRTENQIKNRYYGRLKKIIEKKEKRKKHKN